MAMHTPGANRAKRDHSDDVSDPQSPSYNPSDPEFDPDWSEENSRGNSAHLKNRPANRAEIHSARQVVDGLRKK
jgi:hypothetical protein